MFLLYLAPNFSEKHAQSKTVRFTKLEITTVVAVNKKSRRCEERSRLVRVWRTSPWRSFWKNSEITELPLCLHLRLILQSSVLSLGSKLHSALFCFRTLPTSEIRLRLSSEFPILSLFAQNVHFNLKHEK